MNTIAPLELRQHPDAVLIDVRTPAEFEEAHIPGSHLVPLSELSASHVRELAGEKPVYVVCRSGGRATTACERLVRQGAPQAVVLEGGLSSWQAAGLPVAFGRKTISLERQVRIAAGALVLTGVVLGWTLHPVFFGLAAFVGAGLIFSGVTDYCGLALVLARLPWNSRRGKT